MAQYLAGDRVRVSLGGAVYNAAVIKVHVGDANDVVFAKAGNVGVPLTAAKHILELELMGEILKVRVYLNRCSRVTCRVVQCAYACFFASQFVFVSDDPSCALVSIENNKSSSSRKMIRVSTLTAAPPCLLTPNFCILCQDARLHTQRCSECCSICETLKLQHMRKL